MKVLFATTNPAKVKKYKLMKMEKMLLKMHISKQKRIMIKRRCQLLEWIIICL